MSNASHVIEYFATLGRRKALVCKPVDASSDNHITRIASEVWNEAITDIAIIHPDEDVPDDTWEKVDMSMDGRIVPTNCLIALRRRKHSNRIDHITKVFGGNFATPNDIYLSVRLCLTFIRLALFLFLQHHILVSRVSDKDRAPR
jgi:hypothetical protein